MEFSHPITRKEVQEVLEACGETLDVKPIENLGCGDYGCAFLTNASTVIKLSKQEKEARAARAILDQNLRNPGLPKIFDVYEWTDCHPYDDPIYVIHRENIKNLLWDDPKWADDTIGDLEMYLYKKVENNTITEDDIFNQLLESFEKNPGSSGDESRVEKIAELYAYLLPLGMWLDDVSLDNFGRHNGSPVLRDLGALLIR